MNDFHRQNHTSGEMRLESSGYQRAVHDPDLSIVKEVKFPPSPDSEFEFSNFKRYLSLWIGARIYLILVCLSLSILFKLRET